MSAGHTGILNEPSVREPVSQERTVAILSTPRAVFAQPSRGHQVASSPSVHIQFKPSALTEAGHSLNLSASMERVARVSVQPATASTPRKQ